VLLLTPRSRAEGLNLHSHWRVGYGHMGSPMPRTRMLGCLGRTRTSVLRLTTGRPTVERQGKVNVVPEGGVEPPTFPV
jgi:hypothetical protein